MGLMILLASCAKSQVEPDGEYITFKADGQTISFPYCRIQNMIPMYSGELHSLVIHGAPAWEHNFPAGPTAVRLLLIDASPHIATTYVNEWASSPNVDRYLPARIEYRQDGAQHTHRTSENGADTHITLTHISTDGKFIEGRFEGRLRLEDDGDFITISDGKFAAVVR